MKTLPIPSVISLGSFSRFILLVAIIFSCNCSLLARVIEVDQATLFPSDEEALAKGWRKLSPKEAQDILKESYETEERAPLIKRTSFDSSLSNGIAVNLKTVVYNKTEPDGFYLRRTESTSEYTIWNIEKESIHYSATFNNREGLWTILDGKVFKDARLEKKEKEIAEKLEENKRTDPQFIYRRDFTEARENFSGFESDVFYIIQQQILVFDKKIQSNISEIISISYINKKTKLILKSSFGVNDFVQEEGEMKKKIIPYFLIEDDEAEIIYEDMPDLFTIPAKAKIKIWNSYEEENKDRNRLLIKNYEN